MLKNKVRAVLTLGGIRQSELAQKFGVTRQGITQKLATNRVSASDLIRIATLTGSKLSFEFPSGDRIYLTMDDIPASDDDTLGEITEPEEQEENPQDD